MEETAPGWFLPLALGAFPASMLLVWVLSHALPLNMSNGASEWWATKGFWYIPIAGGVVTGALLFYGASTYETY